MGSKSRWDCEPNEGLDRHDEPKLTQETGEPVILARRSTRGATYNH
jgi:hypothetical protein